MNKEDLSIYDIRDTLNDNYEEFWVQKLIADYVNDRWSDFIDWVGYDIPEELVKAFEEKQRGEE